MKHVLPILLTFVTLTLSAEPWLETCGSSVEKNEQGYWPYIDQFTDFDHQSECTYGGYYATVRALSRYEDYGPHIYLAANKDAYFTIEGIPGGENCTISFDAVCYLNGGASTYNIADLLQVRINDEEFDLGEEQILADAFKTFTLSATVSAETLTIRFDKPSSVAQEVRLDNIKVSYDGETDPDPENPDPEDPDPEDPQEETCLYPELDGKKGLEILAALQTLISDHKVLSYDFARADRANIDFRADGTLIDMYSACTFYASDYCNSSNYDTQVECECYNREHALPKSYWGGSKDEPMYTDFFHLLPTDNATNQKRGTLPYGEVTGSPDWSNEKGTKYGYSSAFSKTVFEPADEFKGDIARIYFYMITCYNDKNFTSNANARSVFTFSNNKAAFTYTARTLLLKWHRNDPVSDRERERNRLIEMKQGNRNPFVDAPDLAEYIWGDKQSQTYACKSGGDPDPDEAIEEVIDTLASPSAVKLILDGHLYILHDGVLYDARGIRVE